MGGTLSVCESFAHLFIPVTEGPQKGVDPWMHMCLLQIHYIIYVIDSDFQDPTTVLFFLPF